MDEHLNSSPYQSLKPNRFSSDYLWLKERRLTPILAGTRIRAWHYARLLDHEVEAMKKRLAPSSLDFLQQRLSALIGMGLLTQEEAATVFKSSPFHSQESSRTGKLWVVTVPLHFSDGGVSPLLGSWGGESAYFWLSDVSLSAKLKSLGSPRVLEIETALSDSFNAFRASGTVLEAWAKRLGAPVVPTGCDLAIENCLSNAKLVRSHTEGDSTFSAVAKAYPEGVNEKIT